MINTWFVNKIIFQTPGTVCSVALREISRKAASNTHLIQATGRQYYKI